MGTTETGRVLVTGGAGFIGSNLVHALAQRGTHVVVFDDFSTGRRANLSGLSDTQIQIVEADLCDHGALRQAMSGCDAVLHQAARPSVQRSLEAPELTHRVNVDGTLAVLSAARATGVRRVVLASSSSVYGNGPELPKHEGLMPRPASPYAASKLAGEAYARAFQESFGLQTVCLRYFNVFGPRQDPASQYAAVIPRFLRAALRGERPVVFGDGEQTRDFTFVANVVDANLRAMRAPEAAGRVFNIAAGARTSLRELLTLIGGLVGRTIDAQWAPARGGEVKHSQADASLAREVLDYAPYVDLAEGLRRTLEWYASAEG